MAFKMKGSPMKLGKIQGTAGHTSALKQKEAEVSALKQTSWWDKTKALGRAVWDAKGEVHGGLDEAQRLYKQYKKERMVSTLCWFYFNRTCEGLF